jgi:MFS family permease
MAGFLDRERSIAKPGHNRWLVPPAALAIHLSIGQVYAYSVFKKPLGVLLGITKPAPDDWSPTQLALIFSVSIAVLGLSAAIFGKWLERVGPRKAMFTAACCFGSGFLVAALGAHLHFFPLLVLGYGVIGGIGLGLGYISPVSTLIKWFPDRPGMATGLAIMGFGGGAMIAAPISVALMAHFATPQSVGVVQSFVVMAVLYFVYMIFGSMIVRVPPKDWKPEGWVPSVKTQALVTTGQVTATEAIKTPQFYLLWAVLFLNVSAGIGILETASPMIQDIFSPRVSAGAAAGFVGLLSIFNMAGRFFWSSLSDKLGRKTVYAIYFILGAVVYGLVPTTGKLGSVPLFVAATCVIISMYGGGFATIPAYLRDLFGTSQVGAIHGRLLTAWSTAGVVGPLLVNYLHESQLAAGVAKAQAYNLTLYILTGFLVVGLICDLLVTPVDPKHNTVEAAV